MKKIIIQTIILLLIATCYSQTTPGEYIINNLETNSKNSDFGPTFFGEDKIVFSSSRGGALKKKWENNQPFLDLYEGTINEDGEISKVKNFSSSLNSEYHESSVSYTPDQKAVYFTRNNEFNEKSNVVEEVKEEDVEENVEETKTVAKEKKKKKKKKKDEIEKTTYLAIYRADVTEDGKWINIEPLPFNNRNYSVGHPAINRDGSKLYFTSDMPGTFGGTDIFVTNILADGKYSKPKNLGRKINTLGKEMFPFIDNKNILYFSSDSRKNGLGGLDLYAIKIYDNSTSDAIHLGEPMNSEDDDFGLIINNKIDEGYFSSNRKKGVGDDDIYHFLATLPLKIECTQNVSGVIKDTKSGKTISDALIVLLNKEGVELNSVKSSSKGVFTIGAPCDGSFKIVGSKSEYENDEKEFLTENNPDAKLELALNLKPIITCKQSVTGIVKSTNSSKPISNALVTILDEKGTEQANVKTSSTGSFTISLPCDTNFKVVGSKDDYENDSKTFSTGNDATAKSDLTLNLKRKIDLTEIKIVKDKIIVNIDPIYFELNKDGITKNASYELNKVVAIMKKYPALLIEGGSHTDARGRSSSNLDLSVRRANSTVAYIVNKGIDGKRITAKGYGETQPANHCIDGVRCNEDLHKQNRRTEFVILNPEVLGYISE